MTRKANGINSETLFNPTYVILQSAKSLANTMMGLISQANTHSLNSHTPEDIRSTVEAIIDEIKADVLTSQTYLRSLAMTAKNWKGSSTVTDPTDMQLPLMSPNTTTKKKKPEDVPPSELDSRLEAISSIRKELDSAPVVQPPRPLKEGECAELKQGEFFSLKAYPEMLCEVKEVTDDNSIFCYIHKGTSKNDEFWHKGTYAHINPEWVAKAEKPAVVVKEFQVGDKFKLNDESPVIFEVVGMSENQLWGRAISSCDPRYSNTIEKPSIFPTNRCQKVDSAKHTCIVGNYVTFKSSPGLIGVVKAAGEKNCLLSVDVIVAPSDKAEAELGRSMTINKDYVCIVSTSTAFENSEPKSYQTGDIFTLHADMTTLFEVIKSYPKNTTVEARVLQANEHWAVGTSLLMHTKYTIPKPKAYSKGDYFRLQNVKAEIFEVVSVSDVSIVGKFVKGYLSQFQIGQNYGFDPKVIVPVNKKDYTKSFDTAFKLEDIVAVKGLANKKVIGIVRGFNPSGIPEVYIVKSEIDSAGADIYTEGKYYFIQPNLLESHIVAPYSVGEYIRYVNDKRMIAQIIEVKPLSLVAVVVRGDADNHHSRGAIHEFKIDKDIRKTTRPFQVDDVVKKKETASTTTFQTKFKVISTSVPDQSKVLTLCTHSSDARYSTNKEYSLEKQDVAYSEEPEMRIFSPGSRAFLVDDNSIVKKPPVLFIIKRSEPNANSVWAECLFSTDKDFVRRKEYRMETCKLQRCSKLPDKALVGLSSRPKTVFMVVGISNDYDESFKVRCIVSDCTSYVPGQNYILANTQFHHPIQVTDNSLKKEKTGFATRVNSIDDSEGASVVLKFENTSTYTRSLDQLTIVSTLPVYSVNDHFGLPNTKYNTSFRVAYTFDKEYVIAECLNYGEEEKQPKFKAGELYFMTVANTHPIGRMESRDCKYSYGDLLAVATKEWMTEPPSEFTFIYLSTNRKALCRCVKSNSKNCEVGRECLLRFHKLQYVSPAKIKECPRHRKAEDAFFSVQYVEPNGINTVSAICENRGSSTFIENQSYIIDKNHLSCYSEDLPFKKDSEICLKGEAATNNQGTKAIFAVEACTTQKVTAKCKESHHPFESGKSYTFGVNEVKAKTNATTIFPCGTQLRHHIFKQTKFVVTAHAWQAIPDSKCKISVRCISSMDSDFSIGQLCELDSEVLEVDEVAADDKILPGDWVSLIDDPSTAFYVEKVSTNKIDVHSVVDIPPYKKGGKKTFEAKLLKVIYTDKGPRD